MCSIALARGYICVYNGSVLAPSVHSLWEMFKTQMQPRPYVKNSWKNIHVLTTRRCFVESGICSKYAARNNGVDCIHKKQSRVTSQLAYISVTRWICWKTRRSFARERTVLHNWDGACRCCWYIEGSIFILRNTCRYISVLKWYCYWT